MLESDHPYSEAAGAVLSHV